MTASRSAVAGITYTTITHTGKVRSQNEDRVFVADWDGNALLIVVADGMGGQPGGAVAAEIVVESFREILDTPLPESREERFELVLAGFYEAANALKERASTDFSVSNMAATAVAALVTAEECLFLHAGDCRLYHFRGGSRLFVTCDHSVVAALRDSGEITAEDARSHPMRSIVTSSISASSNNILARRRSQMD
jgi:PPM family protein phosphatase